MANLLGASLTVEVESPLGLLQFGPGSLLAYTIVQGLFTVLAIKELWSIAGVLIKGYSNDLDIDGLIVWHITENYEDLRKTLKHIFYPCALDLCDRAFLRNRSERRVNRIGWKRVIVAGFFALFLLGADIALIVLSAPSQWPVRASNLQSLMWDNAGPIPILKNNSYVIQGSFSKAVILTSKWKDVEFTRQPSVSLERTDFLRFADFNAKLPTYNETLFVCDYSEGWRLICRVHCENRLYQYKLRLDLDTENDNMYFASTNSFSVGKSAKNTLDHYRQAIREQLGIETTLGFHNKTKFELKATDEPPEYTNLTRRGDGDMVLTHDAIASLFLATVVLFPGPSDTQVYARRKGTRDENPEPLEGVVAESQRPYVPLLITAAIYFTLALISVVVQGNWRNAEIAKDLDLFFEILGKSKKNIFNFTTTRLTRLHSFVPPPNTMEKQSAAEAEKNVGREHRGFIPAKIWVQLEEFQRDRDEMTLDAFHEKWGIYQPNDSPLSESDTLTGLDDEGSV